MEKALISAIKKMDKDLTIKELENQNKELYKEKEESFEEIKNKCTNFYYIHCRKYNLC